MTVAELIKELQELPPDAKLVCEFDDSLHDIDPCIWKSGPNPIILMGGGKSRQFDEPVYWIG